MGHERETVRGCSTARGRNREVTGGEVKRIKVHFTYVH
jgi:hypothetical protein